MSKNAGIYTAHIPTPQGFNRETWFASQGFESVAHFWALPTLEKPRHPSVWLTAVILANSDNGQDNFTQRSKLEKAVRELYYQAVRETSKNDVFLPIPFSRGMIPLRSWDSLLWEKGESFDGDSTSVMAGFLELPEVFEFSISEPLVNLMLDALNIRSVEENFGGVF